MAEQSGAPTPTEQSGATTTLIGQSDASTPAGQSGTTTPIGQSGPTAPTERASATTPTVGGVIDFIRALSAAKAWALLGVIATLLSGTFTLGRYSNSVNLAKAAATPAPTTCAAQPGYPRGAWNTIAVVINTGRKDIAIGRELGYIVSDHKGVWFPGLGKQAPDGTYPSDSTSSPLNFTIKGKLQPGESVHITHESPTEKYVDNGDLIVSSDGCSMKGPFHDTLSGKPFLAGELLFCWDGASKCPAIPAGWRPPVVPKTP